MLGTHTGLAKLAVQCSADSFVVNQTLVLRINICGENRQLLVAANRYKMLGYSTHRLENGKIIEDWVVRDTYGLMIQLGLIQPGKK
jgi:hypothetical protein